MKLNTCCKQIKGVEPVRTEAIRQITKTSDFFHSVEMREGQVKNKVYTQLLALPGISVPLGIGENRTLCE